MARKKDLDEDITLDESFKNLCKSLEHLKSVTTDLNKKLDEYRSEVKFYRDELLFKESMWIARLEELECSAVRYKSMFIRRMNFGVDVVVNLIINECDKEQVSHKALEALGWRKAIDRDNWPDREIWVNPSMREDRFCWIGKDQFENRDEENEELDG